MSVLIYCLLTFTYGRIQQSTFRSFAGKVENSTTEGGSSTQMRASLGPRGCVRIPMGGRCARPFFPLLGPLLGRGERPTSERDGERNSRPYAYYSQYATTVCTCYAFLYSDGQGERCTRKFAKLICAFVDNPATKADFDTL